MELRVLRYFLAVAKEESITSAAQSLNVTQPTLSKQLMELEDELGKKLFLRGNRKITLTEDGLFLRKRAQEIIDLTDKTTSDFNNDCDDIRGNVYIGGGETDAMRFIAKTAKELKKEYPHIRYHLFSGNADDVTERLDKGLLDFGILIEPANMEKYDYIKLPVNDVWGLLMKKDCELAQKKTVCPDDLKEIPILTSRQTLVQNVISGWSGQDFQTFNIVATYNLVYNASLMVDEGVGYALCLDKLINTTGSSNLCFRPLEPRLEAHLNIVWKKYQVFSKATKMFLSKLQSEINNFVSE